MINEIVLAVITLGFAGGYIGAMVSPSVPSGLLHKATLYFWIWIFLLTIMHVTTG